MVSVDQSELAATALKALSKKLMEQEEEVKTPDEEVAEEEKPEGEAE